MEGKRALVTGATGFIGSHLVPELVGQGWDVRTCGRRPRPSWLPEAVDYRVADLASGEGMEEVLDGITHVFHLAGASSSASDEEEMHRTNVVGTEQLLTAALESGVERVLHMSSTSVYGEEVQLPLPIREDVEPQPSRGYGKAKWLGEQVAWRLADKGLPLVMVRPVTVYGPGNVKLLASAILDAAIERHAGLSKLAVHREPVEQRVLHIDDLVAACLHLAGNDAAVGRAFNVCSPHYPSSHELAAVLADELGLELELSDDPDCGLGYEERRATRDRMLAEGMRDDILLSKERFRLLRKVNRNNRLSVEALLSTGFEFAEADLAASVGRTIAWYREHRWIL